jgi:hypothetical protein
MLLPCTSHLHVQDALHLHVTRAMIIPTRVNGSRSVGREGRHIMTPASARVEMPSKATMMWAAQQIVRQHEEPPEPDRATGHCAQCREGGCSLLSWAMAVLAPDLVGSH